MPVDADFGPADTETQVRRPSPAETSVGDGFQQPCCIEGANLVSRVYLRISMMPYFYRRTERRQIYD